MTGRDGWTRRRMLAASAGVAAAAAAGPAAAQDTDDDFDGWFDDVDNYDGIEDATGQSEVTVAVENGGDRTYELRLRSVTTEAGTTVGGGGTTGPVPPGESGSVTGRWDLPEGASPGSVDVEALSRNGTVEKVERTVPLAGVSVRG